MGTLRISKESRHRNSYVLVESDGERWLSFPPRIKFLERTDDVVHVVREMDRLDLIAFEYYKRADWWWIIAERNDIHFPLIMPEIGTRLIVPSYEYVVMELMT